MALLNANEDSLLYDPLRDQDQTVDKLGDQNSNRIAIYDKGLGFAVQPEQKTALTDYKNSVDSQAANQQSQMNTYVDTSQQAFAQGDQQASGILASYKNNPGQQKTTISVLGGGTYTVNADWAKQNAGAISAIPSGSGYVIGKSDQSLLDVLSSAQEQTKQQDDYINQANDIIGSQKEVAQKAINAQKSNAQAAYNQTLDQYQQSIQSIKDQWTNLISQQQKAFQEGIATNTGGIRDLIDSGALILKAEVNK